jgi:von Willebrand factor type A domain
MSRPSPLLAATAILLAFAAFASAESTKVVITVERPKAEPKVDGKSPFTGKRPTVDVAILLDTSNSMDGLINQAKSQLWTIIQQFAKAKKQGQTPALRVALFEYGNMGLPASEGYIRQVVPLTDDLDKLSEALFGLTTNGGDEYCGQVIDVATKSLDWSKEPNGYKAIFIAGNEPFSQGPVDYRQACKLAIERGIVVNTIHCGNHSEGVGGSWQDGARLAEGESFNIDQDRAVVQIRCPQDEIIIRLNAELNKTYLWYGAEIDRAAYGANQMAQDSNAEQSGPASAATRAVAKASGVYNNVNRDLVDTYAEDKSVLQKVKAAELPPALQAMPVEAREKYVTDMATQRADIQRQIADLSVQREAYLAKEQTRLAAETGEATLGDAVVMAIQKQLADSGFEQTPPTK